MAELLRHEVDLLRAAINEGLQESIRAELDLGEAVTDSNSYHDNSAYDDAISRMKFIDARYTPIALMLNRVEIVDYPEAGDKKVRLGSLVGITIEEDPVDVLLVGQLKVGSDMYTEKWKEDHDSEFDVVSPDSPLGAAIIGKDEGEQSSLVVNNNELQIDIKTVDQSWISRFAV